MLASTLAQDPDHVTTVLVQTPIERDEGAQLLDRVADPVLELLDGAVDVRALLGGVDERARQPRLAAVDAVDRGLGDPGGLRHRADGGSRPSLVEEAGARR